MRGRNDEVVWLKLTGATNSRDPRYYYGYLLDVADTVRVIKSIVDNDAHLQVMITEADSPALLLDADNGRVIAANSLAEKLFGRSSSEMEQGKLCDLLTKSMTRVAKRMREDVPFSRKWVGKLDYCTPQGRVTAETVVRYVVHDQRKLLRLLLLQPKLAEPIARRNGLLRKNARAAVEQAIEGVDDMAEIMRAALRSPMIDGKYDGVMFSDVQERTNKVVVFGAGDPFDEMPQGETFSYKGTIAEDIARYGLDHLIVDDTQDSIKPIDWALFLPHGIRSYFAKPYQCARRAAHRADHLFHGAAPFFRQDRRRLQRSF